MVSSNGRDGSLPGSETARDMKNWNKEEMKREEKERGNKIWEKRIKRRKKEKKEKEGSDEKMYGIV